MFMPATSSHIWDKLAPSNPLPACSNILIPGFFSTLAWKTNFYRISLSSWECQHSWYQYVMDIYFPDITKISPLQKRVQKNYSEHWFALVKVHCILWSEVLLMRFNINAVLVPGSLEAMLTDECSIKQGGELLDYAIHWSRTSLQRY